MLSPAAFISSRVRKIQIAGGAQTQSIEKRTVLSLMLCSIFPHDGYGDDTPSPNKLNEDSVIMAEAHDNVAETVI